MRLPAWAAGLHVPRASPRCDAHTAAGRSDGLRNGGQSSRSKRAPSRMAKGVGKSRAKRGSRPGTRSFIALVLVGFVLMATGVIARRVLGVAAESSIRRLRQRRDGLEAERIRLEGVIREASSRARLQPIAEQRLNMHIPSPDQQVLLARPTTPASPQRNP